MKFFARLSSENGCLRRRPNFQAGPERSGAVRSVRTMRKTANYRVSNENVLFERRLNLRPVQSGPDREIRAFGTQLMPGGYSSYRKQIQITHHKYINKQSLCFPSRRLRFSYCKRFLPPINLNKQSS